MARSKSRNPYLTPDAEEIVLGAADLADLPVADLPMAEAEPDPEPEPLPEPEVEVEAEDEEPAVVEVAEEVIPVAEIAALREEIERLRRLTQRQQATSSRARPEGTYPVSYANPKVINEQFYVPGSPYRKRFVNGRFVATNAQEEAAVRACLAAYGRDKADRWRGEDRQVEWIDRKTGFRTFNEAAKYDFEIYHEQ